MTLALGLLIVAAAVYAVLRRVDVRLALLTAALALGAMSGDVRPIVQTFLVTLTREQFVVPICCAMGFAHVLRFTGCDQHLVHLLVRPIQRVRPALVPGAVLVGFLVNIPVISQTSTVVAVGPVLIPLLQAARIAPVTIGAALLLGASIGGELLNPGAPELQSVSAAVGVESFVCVDRVLPLLAPHLTIATALFWWLHRRGQRKAAVEKVGWALPQDRFTVNPFKASVPLLPIVLLFLLGAPLHLFTVPRSWLLQETGNFD